MSTNIHVSTLFRSAITQHAIVLWTLKEGSLHIYILIWTKRDFS